MNYVKGFDRQFISFSVCGVRPQPIKCEVSNVGSVVLGFKCYGLRENILRPAKENPYLTGGCRQNRICVVPRVDTSRNPIMPATDAGIALEEEGFQLLTLRRCHVEFAFGVFQNVPRDRQPAFEVTAAMLNPFARKP